MQDAESQVVPQQVQPTQGAAVSAPLLEPNEVILSDEQTSSSHPGEGRVLRHSERTRKPNSKYFNK